MVGVERETGEQSCNSCVDREKHTHKIIIGNANSATVLHLCKDCLENLYDETAETLNK